jgi:hypothetical protein
MKRKPLGSIIAAFVLKAENQEEFYSMEKIIMHGHYFVDRYMWLRSEFNS